MINGIKTTVLYFAAVLLIVSCYGKGNHMPGGQRSYENIASILNQLPEVLATAVDNTGKMSISDYESSEEPDTASIQLEVADLAEKHDQNKNYGTLVLVTHITHCRFCLDELDFWQEWTNSENSNPMGAQKPTVLLVITGAKDADAGLFVKNHGYTFKTLLDTDDRLAGYVPDFGTPFKLFIDHNHHIEDIRPIGTNENLNRYVSSVIGI